MPRRRGRRRAMRIKPKDIQPAGSFPIELYSDSRIAEFDKADSALGLYLSNKSPEINEEQLK